jgi:hemerythrin-like domain-containing protein
MAHESIQNVTGKHAGQSGAPSTAIRALTGVFAKLVEQHRQVAALLERAEASQSALERQELWSELRRQLLSHERAEVLEVYAALEGYDAARDMVEEHTRQAGELESAMNEVDAVDYDSDTWVSKLRDVMALVDDHVRDEETNFFPRAQEILGEQASRELEERFVGAQRQVIQTLL